MTKRFWNFFILIVISVSCFAIPAKRGVYRMITLADGSQVRAELRGDEHVNYWQTEDGRNFVKGENPEFYVSADVDAMCETYLAQKEQLKANITGPRRAAGEKPSEPIVGSRKGIVVLVQFSDVQFEEGHDVDYYDKIINTKNFSSDEGYIGSVRDYFLDQSDNQLDYTFDVFGIVTLPNEAAYYGSNSGSNTQKNMKSFITTTLQSIKADVDFSKYDNDNDGYVDNIFFIYAGHGEADGGGDDCIWPHMYYYYTGYGASFYQNGVRVDVYACSNEMQMSGKSDGIGAICHEFSHCLGLPDMYDTGSVGNYGTGDWDVMDAGSYNGDSFVPAAYNAYERDYCGWKKMIELTDDAVYSNVPGLCDGGSAYVMYNKANTNEYYIVEPRSLTRWDSYLAGDGILIYHVDYDYYTWRSNTVNNTSGHQRCAIVAADDSYGTGSSNAKADAYPSGSNNQFSDITTPASTLFNANTDGTTQLGRSIYDITRNADGTFSFSFMNGTYKYDNHAPEGSLFYESFDKCVGTGGNDGVFTGTMTTNTLDPDNVGWASLYKYAADKCARVGSKSNNGTITTPEFTILGAVTLSFKAASYATECGGVTLSIASGDATITDTACKISTVGAWNDFSTTIEGTGAIKVKFTGTKRWFLDEVLVMPAASGIESVEADNATNNGATYNIAGQKVGDNYRGIVIRNGHKYIK